MTRKIRNFFLNTFFSIPPVEWLSVLGIHGSGCRGVWAVVVFVVVTRVGLARKLAQVPSSWITEVYTYLRVDS